MKRILALVLAMLTLLLSFVACTPADTPDDETTNTSANTNEVTTSEQPSDPVAPENQVTLADLANYVIVRPDTTNVATYSAATKLKSKINQLSTGASCTVKTDVIKEGWAQFQEQECEILVGDTNRAQTATYKQTLRSNDYGYTLIDKKIVIFGHTAETIEKAVDLFIENILSEKALQDGVLFAASDAVTKKGTYSINRVSLAGNHIKNCVIVYAKNSTDGRTMAEDLQDFLFETIGYLVPVQSDTVERADGTYEILLGYTNRPESVPADLEAHQTYILSTKQATLVSGADAMGWYHAYTLFKQMFETEEVALELNIKQAVCESADDATMRIMSFNLKTGEMSNERTANAIAMIKKYSPDLLGVQEGNNKWMSSLKSALSDDYGCIGVGRDANLGGEHCAIFYKKSEFNVIESDTKWLSDTPDVSGSKYESSDYIRIVTWAVFERKSDGKQFVYANTHLDWGALQQQCNVLMNFMKKYDYPMFLTGDFNMRSSNSAYQSLVKFGFQDSLNKADYFYATEQGRTDWQSSTIDHCMVKTDLYYVSEYRVCDEGINGQQVSDHYPIYADFLLP